MNLQNLESQLEVVKANAKAMLNRFQLAANTEGRTLTPTEHASVQAIIDEGRGIKSRIDRARADASMSLAINEFAAGMVPDREQQRSQGQPRSLGAQFIADAGYRAFIKAQGHRSSGSWTSPPVELLATTLDTSSASGGPLILPDNQPGIIMLPQRPIVLADRIAPGTTESNLVQFMKEKTFTNAAAPVAEAGTKPESTLVFEAATSAVKKIAHWFPVTEEALEDYGQMMSIIDMRLRSGVDLTEQDQLLNGTGVGENLLGFLTLPGLAAAVARGTDTNSDAILRQINSIQNSVNIRPDTIIINPVNFQTVQLTKTSTGEYISGGTPFSTPPTATLWGLPCIVTSVIPANTALVGAFGTCAQLFRKGGIRVEASNSHASFFVENKVAIRAEERLALCVYREAAFGKVTGLN